MLADINSEHFEPIIELIESNNELIQYDYNGKENQILIPKVLVNKTHLLMSDIGLDKADYKEYIKLSIKEGFELSGNDIVISKNGAFFIKLFEKMKKHEVEEKDKDTIANRYNGIDEEELELFYDEFFEENENKNFFASVAVKFVDKYLKQNKITNEMYEKNVFSYIHNITFKHLVETYDDSDGFFTGFAGYIFRIHFKDVFEHIADILLNEISISNSHIIDFLKYYSQDIIVVGGKKYKVPAMEAKDGLKWNVGSMLSIAKIYTKSNKALRSLKKDITNIKVEIKKLYIGEFSPLEYQAAHIKTRQEIETDIVDESRELETYLDALDLAESENDKHEIKKEIHAIREEIGSLREEKSKLSEVVVSQGTLSQYTHLHKELDSFNRQLKREQLIISQNRDAYQSIRESLIKALISKKSLL